MSTDSSGTHGSGAATGVPSYPQEQMWLTDQLLGSAAVSAPTMCVRVRGPFDARAARRAVEAVVERHRVLRSTFAMGEDGLTQRVASGAALDHAVEDLAGGPPSRWRDACVREVRRGFDLRVDFPLRLRIYRLAEDDHVVLAVRHHIVGDGRSDEIFAEEFAANYRAFAEGRVPEPPPLRADYLDYARRSRERLTGDRLAGLVDGAVDALSGAARTIALPLDRPRPKRRTGPGDSFTLSLAPRVAEGVRDLAGRAGTSPYMVLLALFRVLLWRRTGQANVAVAAPVESRTRAEWSGVIGCFLNTLLLPGEVSGEDSAAELARREKFTLAEAFARQELPYALLARRAPESVPRPEVMLTYQVDDQPTPALPGLEVEPIDLPGVGSQFDLMVKVIRDDPGLRVQCAYDDEIFDRGTVRSLMDRYAALLEEAGSAPDVPVGRLAATAAIGSARPAPPDPFGAEPIRVLAWSGDDAAEGGPENPMQRMIAEAWTDLRLDAADVHRSLLESGGHSLTVARLATALSEATGLEVGVADLFGHQTIAEQAVFLERLLGERFAALDPEATASVLTEIESK